MALSSSRYWIATIFCISILHAYGIYMFADGFLLTKFMLNNTSYCDDDLTGEKRNSHIEPGNCSSCWHPPSFKRAIIIVIDALRFDFTAPYPQSSGFAIPAWYHNKLTILHETARSRPAHSFLTPFIADPPTTTLQRLKALTTGSLPTFIEAGSNFAGLAIEEDNLISQLVAAGKVVVQLGDDTWQSLFPGLFHTNLSQPFESFNIRDLHSVDDGIMEHLPHLIALNDASWDVAIAHFLGLDHAGHRYGPDHPAMSAKLLQMNGIIGDVMNQIDEDTLLVVMGDHGMDSQGNHGGESDDEVTAALWLYSRKPAFGRVPAGGTGSGSDAIRQIDIVPTLSLLLGVPIPFNNLGSLIQEAFLGALGSGWKNLALASRTTSLQIRRYHHAYSEMRNIGHKSRQHQLELQITEVPGGNGSEDWRELSRLNRQYQRATLEDFHQLWASFNYHSMTSGILILIATLTLLLKRTVIGMDQSTSSTRLILAAVMGPIVCVGEQILLPSELLHLVTTYGTSLAIVLVSSICAVRAWATSTSSHMSLMTRTLVLLAMAQAAGFASNSYTIHEDSVVSLCLTTFGFLSSISSLRLKSPRVRFTGCIYSALFAVLTRISSLSQLCRDEQVAHCSPTFYVSSASQTALWRLCIPYVICSTLPEVIAITYVPMIVLGPSTKTWIRCYFRLGLILVALYSTADTFDNGEWYKGIVSDEFMESMKLLLARSVLALAFLSVPWLHVRAQFSKAAAPSSASSTSGNDNVLVAGSEGYSSPAKTEWYILYLLSAFLVIALLLPPMGQFSLAICLLQILFLSQITSASTSSTQQLNPGISSIVLAMLGSHHFFRTGHQAVLASIQWGSAYILFRSIHQPWTTLILLLNSFGAQILCALALPLFSPAPSITNAKQLQRIPSTRSESRLHLGILAHMLYYALMQLASTVWAAILRRHLMLYRVFMPRYLMGTILLIVIDIVLVIISVVQ